MVIAFPAKTIVSAAVPSNRQSEALAVTEGHGAQENHRQHKKDGENRRHPPCSRGMNNVSSAIGSNLRINSDVPEPVRTVAPLLGRAASYFPPPQKATPWRRKGFQDLCIVRYAVRRYTVARSTPNVRAASATASPALIRSIASLCWCADSFFGFRLFPRL
jgi:hypothetical protein